MTEMIKNMPNVKKFSDYITNIKNNLSPIMLSGLTDVGKVHFAYATHFYAEKPIVLITYNEMQAKKITKDLNFFQEKIVYFPKKEIVTYDYVAESRDILNYRIEALNQIYKNDSPIIVTTIEAVCQKIISKDNLYKNVLDLKLGERYGLEELKEKLVLLGYERYDLVEGKGQFSVRGGIVDIATSSEKGIRIEFFGDEIDSIRVFNISSQKSVEMIENISIYPAYEFVSEKSPEDATLLDYLPENHMIFLDEIEKIQTRLDNIIKSNKNIIAQLIEKERTVPDSLKNTNDYIAFIENITDKQVVYLGKNDLNFIDKKSMLAKRNGYSFSYREANFFRSTMDLLLEEIQKAVNNNKTVIILNEIEENKQAIDTLLKQNNVEVEGIFNGIGSISTGFESEDFNLFVISTAECFENSKVRKKYSEEYKQGQQVQIEQLKVGDYVVHKNQGIGKFVGINTIKAGGIIKDYIKILYQDDGILYVPTNSLDNIRRYIATGDVAPKLNKLGTKDWQKTKEKVKSNLRVVAQDLMELYAKRAQARGFAFSKDTDWQNEFEALFPYTETEDQLRSIEEVKRDMEQIKPMDRLLCGDVGYGKTEVAIRAAFKACMDGKQVAYLVPTTILSNQQYQTFKERMEKFSIKVEILNRFKTPKQQAETIKRLKLGETDVVIGTHRMLSEDIGFKNLGLLIVDEEHRFGVKAKEKIKAMKSNIDVLSMSATPIPRTLHMSIVGVRDMSVIYDPPHNRKPVQTYVLEYDEDVIKEAITKELEREGQVFYLLNSVDGVSNKALYIESLVTEAQVAFAHGRMTGQELENIMQKFIDKEIDVLVCTTILESGIDIPNANTIIVENADRLGLAQLYQIRGRVGRSDIQAYAYITYKRDKLISEVAEKRLRAIKEFTEFGSGFKIAMRDLEIRGAGSLLGEVQHGHLDMVGYDMYCKLLDEVMKESKGEIVEEDEEIQIDIAISCYIPDSFIDKYEQKIEIYQNIALCATEKDIQNITDDIIDRYGNIPKEIENLLEISRIKNLCKQVGIIKISQKDNKIVYTCGKKFNLSSIEKLIKNYTNKIRVSEFGTISLFVNEKDIISERALLNLIKNFLEKAK